MKWIEMDTEDIMRESGTYRDILEHRKNCPKWTKEFCMDCFGGGLTLFLGKLKYEFALHANRKEVMVCAVDGCGEVDESHSAYCVKHGRSHHKMIIINEGDALHESKDDNNVKEDVE